jgi:hypothetical protein
LTQKAKSLDLPNTTFCTTKNLGKFLGKGSIVLYDEYHWALMKKSFGFDFNDNIPSVFTVGLRDQMIFFTGHKS